MFSRLFSFQHFAKSFRGDQQLRVSPGLEVLTGYATRLSRQRVNSDVRWLIDARIPSHGSFDSSRFWDIFSGSGTWLRLDLRGSVGLD